MIGQPENQQLSCFSGKKNFSDVEKYGLESILPSIRSKFCLSEFEGGREVKKAKNGNK